MGLQSALQAGLVGSWSGYAAYTHQHPEDPDMLKRFLAALHSEIGIEHSQPVLKVASQVSLVLARAV